MELKDYLHFYLGCEVEYEGVLNGPEIKEELKANKHDVFYIPKIQEIKGRKRGFLREIRCNQSGRYTVCKVGRRGLKSFWGIPDFKLVLRPLSSMTEEEASILKQMDIRPDESVFNKIKATAQINNWLRKNSFDIDGLIEAGLAIDSTQNR